MIEDVRGAYAIGEYCKDVCARRVIITSYVGLAVRHCPVCGGLVLVAQVDV